MGLIDEIVGKAAGLMGGDAGDQSGPLGGIIGMLAGRESGGLAGLVQSFQQKGLGGIISSWIGTGENQPISADQIQEALGSDTIRNLAEKFGVPSEELSGKLADFLPSVIDKMTPDGTIPEDEA